MVTESINTEQETTATAAPEVQFSPVSLDDALWLIGDKVYGLLICILSLLVLSPIGLIPAFPSVCGIILCALAWQIVSERPLNPPQKVATWFQTNTVGRRLLGLLNRYGAWLTDTQPTRRAWMMVPPFVLLPVLLIILSGAMMPVFEILSLPRALPAGIAALTAIGLIVRDGAYLVVAGCFLSIAACVALFAT
ncbi:exopolysaccharide biosynthesis protein [Litoreibacter roseus]|uniref:Exopolysaccharide synthesis, ExoD n=1 Tax=Litoreibacter roseus TaxID=2601869 RepID=A0A6N6JGB2_9RHOB|nr:exopolysaccharide biosynthesis protein [Litoreibacter roseus]GFE65381.1 hypothetical protein KIN_24550 [Litoreibacter roseus]